MNKRRDNYLNPDTIAALAWWEQVLDEDREPRGTYAQVHPTPILGLHYRKLDGLWFDTRDGRRLGV